MSQRYFVAAAIVLVLGLGSAAAVAEPAPDLVPVTRVEPAYPYQAARRGVSGWVDVQVTVNRDGTVRSAKVVGSQPKGVFDNAALNAIVKWTFEPRGRELEAVQRFGFQAPKAAPAEPAPEAAPEATPEVAPEAAPAPEGEPTLL